MESDFFSELDSETDIDNLKQIDSALCQIVSSGSNSKDTSTAAQAQGDRLTPNTSEIGLVAKDGKNGNTSNCFQNKGVGYKLGAC